MQRMMAFYYIRRLTGKQSCRMVSEKERTLPELLASLRPDHPLLQAMHVHASLIGLLDAPVGGE